MAHFTTIETSAAGWASDRPVVQSDFWHFDECIGKSLNADDGGTWAPATQIVLGGSGLSVTGAFSVSSATASFQSLYCAADITATGNATIGGDLIVSGNFISLGESPTSDIISVSGIQSYAGAETHNGAVTFNSSVTLGNNSTSDTLTVSAIETHNGAETHNGSATFNGNVTLGNNTTGDTLNFLGVETHSGACYFQDDIQLGSASSDTLTINATETHNAPCTFNANVTVGNSRTGDLATFECVEQHNGSCYLNGNTTIASGKDKPTVEVFAISTSGVGRAVTDANSLVVSGLSGATRSITMSIAGLTADARKFIKNCDATYTLTVYDGATLQAILTLAPLQSGWVVSDSGATRWY